jgi:yecA family protein
LLDLTDRAEELLQMCVAGVDNRKAIVEWGVPGNRPPLRLIAQRIDAMLDSYSADDDDEIDRLQQWMLELNPNDNHGYRNPVMQTLLLAGNTERAIELARHYPEDVGDMPFDLALALFLSGRKMEAKEAWMRGVNTTPGIAETLLAKNPEPPEFDDFFDDDDDEDGEYDDRYEVLGGPEHAWRYRTAMLESWKKSGALAWAGTLPRIAAPKPKKLPMARGGKKGKQPPVGLPLQDFAKDLDETKLLQSLIGHGFAVVPLHGMLTAVTLSPRMMMPGQWLTIALEYRKGQPSGSIDELNAAIQPLMGLYNCINYALRMKRGEGYMPSPQVATAEPAQATEWARGFMRIVEQGRAAWRDKTSSERGKAALTTIERAAAGMVSGERLRQEAAALDLPASSAQPVTWHDVLAAATSVLAGA